MRRDAFPLMKANSARMHRTYIYEHGAILVLYEQACRQHRVSSYISSHQKATPCTLNIDRYETRSCRFLREKMAWKMEVVQFRQRTQKWGRSKARLLNSAATHIES